MPRPVPTQLLSLQQAAVWVETRRVPEYPIHRPIAPDAVRELHDALMAGTITASGCVDGGERREILPGEWNDYCLRLKHTAFPGNYSMPSAGAPIIKVLSIRSFPAAALKYHGYPSGVRVPSASAQDGEPGYHRVITNVLLPRERVVRYWPPGGRAAPLPGDRSDDPGSRSGSGAKTRGIAGAIDELWPNEIPKGLTAKDRNKQIIKWLVENGCSVPTNPERAIQRVLKARPR